MAKRFRRKKRPGYLGKVPYHMQLGSRQGHPKLGRVLLVDRILDFQAKVPVSLFTQRVQLQSFGYLAILPAGCRSANGDRRISAFQDSQSVIGEVVDLLTAFAGCGLR